MTESDPRAQYRQLPDRVHPEQLVETTDADPPMPPETELEEVWRRTVFGPGTP